MKQSGGLFLMRKAGETVVIGDDILVSIERINGKQVHLRILAPQDVEVDRWEIRERKRRLTTPTNKENK